MTTTPRPQIEQMRAAFEKLVGRQPVVTIRVPTVIHLLGGELESSEGWRLSGTVEPEGWLMAAPTTDNKVTIHALNFGETAAFQLPHLELFASSVGGRWINFAMGMAWALQKAGQRLGGMEAVVLAGGPATLPYLLAWEALAGLTLDALSRAHLAQKAESAFVGVSTDLATPFVCVASRAHQLLLLDGRTFSHERIPLRPDVAVVLVDSGDRTGAAVLPDRARECEEATAVFRQHLPHIKTLRDVTSEQLEMLGHHLPETLRRRAGHVVSECARVQAAATALRDGDLPALGRLLRQSHLSLRDHYESSVPALDLLAATAWGTPGCYGARPGSDGLLQVLVEEEAVPHLVEALNAAFEKAYGRTPPSLVTTLTDGANAIRNDEIE